MFYTKYLSLKKNMRRNYFLLSILLIISSSLINVGCKEYSTKSLSVEKAGAELILPEQPDSSQIASVVQASRIWGFAKYHHPAFSSNSKNADAEYFSLLKKVLQAPDTIQNKIFAEWIASLGLLTERNRNNEKLETFNDFKWITDSIQLGKVLSQTLLELRKADPGENCYVTQTPTNVSFIEPKYTDIPEDDVAYKLLGVAKFWNAIDSYSPNRNLTDRPWNDILIDYITLAFDRSINFPTLYSRMVSELCDTHVNSWFIPIFGGRFIPIICRFAEERLFVVDTCTLVANNFRVGDEIILIDSLRPMERLTKLSPYIPHSNPSALLRDGSYATLLTPKDKVWIEYLRDGEIHKTTLSSIDSEKFIGRIYSSLYSSVKPKFEEVADSIACIRINGLTCADELDLGEFLNSYNKLIIDLRAYPAEYNVINELLPKYFFSQSRKAIEVLLPQANYPGTFIRLPELTKQSFTPNKLFKGQIVLLVNSCTQSMSEYFTMLLQTIPGVITMGSQTAGADGNVTRIQLPYAAFNLTGLGVCYPDGINAQRNGVKIDIVIEPSAKGMIYGEDEQLQAAINYLKGC